MKRCVVDIRRPDNSEVAAKGKDVPSVWFPTMSTMAAVLPEDNPARLCSSRDAKPMTLAELAALSGRQVPNLLRMMEAIG